MFVNPTGETMEFGGSVNVPNKLQFEKVKPFQKWQDNDQEYQIRKRSKGMKMVYYLSFFP